MDKSTRILIACACGAYFGTECILALWPSYPYLAWIGTVFGGVSGYCLYDLSAFPVAFRMSWKVARAIWSSTTQVNWKRWRRIIRRITGPCVAVLFPLIVFLSETICLTYSTLLFSPQLELTIYLLFVFVMVFSSLTGILAYATLVGLLSNPYWTRKDVKYLRWFQQKTFTTSMIATFPPILLWYIWKYRILIIRSIARGIKTITMIPVMSVYTFTRTFFRIIHSDERLICLVGAATGAAIGGYYFGSASFGGLSGALIGIADYEIFGKRTIKLPTSPTPPTIV